MITARFAVLLLLLSAPNLLAQTVTVAGRATDAQGAVVAGASVTLTSTTTRSAQAGQTGGDGTFQFRRVGDRSLRARDYGHRVLTIHTGAHAGRGCDECRRHAADRPAGGRRDRPGGSGGSAPTTRMDLPIRDVPITVNAVQSQVIREQGVNDLVSALRNVSGVTPYTNYGVYEWTTFPRVRLRQLGAARRRHEE